MYELRYTVRTRDIQPRGPNAVQGSEVARGVTNELVGTSHTGHGRNGFLW